MLDLTVLEDLDVVLTLKIAGDSRRDYTRECVLTFAEHSVQIAFDRGEKVVKFLVNSRDLSDIGSCFQGIQGTGLIPYFVEASTSDMNRKMYPPRSPSFFVSLLSEIQKHVHKSTGGKTIFNLAMSFGIGSSNKMLQAMQNSSQATVVWKRQVSRWTIDSMDFQFIRDLLIAHRVIELLLAINKYIEHFARYSSYIAPLRSTAERYYRLQNLAVDEVDSQGRNLAMFLSNLNNTERKHFSEWTENYFDFAAQVSEGGGHISIRMRESGSVEEFNLADMGFGFSQILPILELHHLELS